MKTTSSKIILIAIVCLAVLVCAFVIWKSHSIPAAPTSSYVVRDGKVYWDEHLQVQWDDNKTHDQLNEFAVADADAATFKTMPLKKGADLEADADPQMFAAENSAWGKDEENIFDQGQKVVRLEGTTTPTIDTATFETVGGVFIRDKQGVYQVQNYHYSLIPGVDPKSFVFVNQQYAKDAHAVYFLQDTGTKYEVLPVAGLDPDTFRVVGMCGSAEGYSSYAVADSKAVYVAETAIPGADPASFRIVAQVDKNPDGFPVTGSYAVDKNHVYKDCGEIVQGADPAQCDADSLKGCEPQ